MGDRSKSDGLLLTDEEWRILFAAPIREYLIHTLGGRRDPSVMIHRQQCAAITNGCVNVHMWEGTNDEARVRNMILNGWRLDHGKWVCGLPHDKKD